MYATIRDRLVVSLLAMLASLATSSCGFLGETPFAGARVADVAPWNDEGALAICDGPVRLGVPMLGSAGLCLSVSSSTPACDHDAQCASREACVCGRCRIAVCDSTEECASNQVCTFSDRRCDRSCTADSDCDQDERCVPGMSICRGTCSTSADCQHGEHCEQSNRLCVADTCSADDDCGGLRCELQRVPSALTEPSVLVDGSELVLYFQRTDPGGAAAIWRATGDDGKRFTCSPDAALLPGRAPSVVMGRDGARMLYATDAGVLAATSPDGLSFTPGTRAALPGADQPSLIVAADGSWIAYAQRDGEIVRATSIDGASFSIPEVVLTPAQVTNPTLWRDVSTIRSPCAQSMLGLDGHTYVWLWFSAFGQESGPSVQFGVTTTTPPDFSIGVAASADGIHFTPYDYDPVFDRVSDFITPLSELAPAVVRIGAGQLLYYERAAATPSTDPSAAQNLGVAGNPTQP